MTYQQYLLTVFIEECLEVAHAASKVQRFTPGDSAVIGEETNLEHLNEEWSQLLAMTSMLITEGITLTYNHNSAIGKIARVQEYAIYSQQLGVIDKDARIS